MEDPSNGSKPAFDGAFDRTGSPGKPNSRRGKRRRSGKSRAAALSPAKGQPQANAGDGERPEKLSGPDNSPGADGSRKRKRRRKKGGQARPQLQQQAATGQAQPQEKRSPASRKKQQRNRRSLQGRPLAPSADKAAPVVARPQPPVDLRPHAQADKAFAPPPSDLYAALDLGTNNCRLLIAQPTRPGNSVLWTLSRESFGLARGWAPAAGFPKTPWSGRSKR